MVDWPTLARFGADADGCANLDERLCIGSLKSALLVEASAQAANAMCGPQRFAYRGGRRFSWVRTRRSSAMLADHNAAFI